VNDYKLLAHVAKEIDKLREDQAIFLNGGGAKDFAEYRHVCGVIRGLTHADQIVRDLAKKMEYSDD
jgi:hypothetical protein